MYLNFYARTLAISMSNKLFEDYFRTYIRITQQIRMTLIKWRSRDPKNRPICAHLQNKKFQVLNFRWGGVSTIFWKCVLVDSATTVNFHSRLVNNE
jgi:hypothetical protein